MPTVGVRGGEEVLGWEEMLGAGTSYLLFNENMLHHVDVVVHAVWGCTAGDEPDLEEAVYGKPDVRDEPDRTAQSLHRLSHPLRRRVPAHQIMLVSHHRCHRRCRRRHDKCRCDLEAISKKMSLDFFAVSEIETSADECLAASAESSCGRFVTSLVKAPTTAPSMARLGSPYPQLLCPDRLAHPRSLLLGTTTAVIHSHLKGIHPRRVRPAQI